ncbi:MAG TPA: SDR family oxidoreductase [Limnochordia bacterium]|nr:SDR family oxidoreductase [Limnochordia bacterium]
MRHQDRVVLITGAGSGIGRAAAERFAGEGAKVVVTDLNAGAAEATATALTAAGAQAMAVSGDVADEGQSRKMVEAGTERFGRIDILFNNAGIGCVGRVDETAIEEFDRVLRVHVRGTYLMCQAVLPQMMARKAGVILNMSSAIAAIGLAQRAAYGAAKTAIMGLTRCMAVDYTPMGIRVVALAPGTINTPFVQNYLKESYADPAAALEQIKKRQLTGDLGTPEDVANAAVFLTSDEARLVIGSALFVDGGFVSGK